MTYRKADVLYQIKLSEGFSPFTGIFVYPDKKDLIQSLIKENRSGLLFVRVRGFIVAELLTKFINVFGDEIVIQKYINPFGSAVFPRGRYRVRVKPTKISKLFNSQSAFFKFRFELFISHFSPLLMIIENYSKKVKQSLINI